MKILRSIILFLALWPFVAARGAEPALGATIVAVSGTASVALPGGGPSGAAVGTVLPVGATVTTTGGGQVTLKFFDGTVTLVQPESNVTILERSITTEHGDPRENTLLELRAGGVVTSLDPAKKKITNFRVRTPKGVAAARGTVFAVRISQNQSDATVTTMSGTVTYVTDQGEFTVPFGQVSSGNGVSSVADAVKANPNLAKEILEATAAVAAAVGSGNVANTEGSPNLVTTVLAAIVDVAVQAAPGNAADILKTVIAAAGPALQGGNGGAVVGAITTAAVQAATKADPAAGEKASADLQAAAAQAAAEAGVKGEVSTENPILPPLDKTQIIVSPSGK